MITALGSITPLFNFPLSLGSAAFLRSVGAQALRGRLAKNSLLSLGSVALLAKNFLFLALLKRNAFRVEKCHFSGRLAALSGCIQIQIYTLVFVNSSRTAYTRSTRGLLRKHLYHLYLYRLHGPSGDGWRASSSPFFRFLLGLLSSILIKICRVTRTVLPVLMLF